MKMIFQLTVSVVLMMPIAIARADWTFDEDNGLMWLKTNVDNDVDETRVSLFRDGSRIRFEISEWVGGQMVRDDDFREGVDGPATAITINGSDKIETVYVDPAVIELISVTVRGAGGNDTIDGGSHVLGDDGDDVIVNSLSMVGLAGDDTLIAGPRTEIIVGNGGDDLLDASLAEKACKLYGLDDDDVLIGSGFDDVIKGGPGDDRIWGGDGDDEIRGGDPGYEGRDRDTIFGEKGNDTIYGAWDNDLIFGGEDDDVIAGDEGSDFLVGDDGDDVLKAGSNAIEGDFLLGLSGADVFVAIGWPDNYFTDYSHRAGDYWFDVRPRRR